ncbi:DUF2934 domain-containing protein [Povalibacter sp.]|uniref:DUF2934 domain-containing protein n=1 Tax=Povalibacter sp. TaxID=1962978 RepID=UPI002F41A2CD
MNTQGSKKQSSTRRQVSRGPGNAQASGDGRDVEVPGMVVDEVTGRPTEYRKQVATAAYYLALKRGFEPGHELEDWLAAERELGKAQTSVGQSSQNGSTSDF